MKYPFQIFTIAATAALPAAVSAQVSRVVTDADADYKLGRDLYLKGQNSIAFPMLKTLDYDKTATVQLQKLLPVNTQTDARFYTIISGLDMNDPTAETDAKAFIVNTYSAPHIQIMRFHLAEYYFRMENFTAALAQYEAAGYDNLDNQDISSIKFHQGYCYFLQKDFAKAKPLFNAIRQIPSDPNYIHANYYYGFLLLGEKKYAEALVSFQKVEKSPEYATVVPFYISQIYYLMGDRDKAVSYAESALKEGNQYYARDMQQLIGHALFDQQKFSQARPYLEQYLATAPNAAREDIYELSYCYYVDKIYDKSITGFKKLGGKEDSLAQNSMYLLGDAYLKTGDRSNARNAFLFCSLNSSNAEQKEISSFNYAKLSYELNYQDIALTEIKKFVSDYPNSTYRPEAEELMASLLGNTNNYQEALTLIQKIGLKSTLVKKVYPRVLYGRSVELINDQRLTEADILLDKAIKADYNENVIQPAYFWKGEIAFRQDHYDEAVQYLSKYLQKPDGIGDVNKEDAQYTLGYAYLRNQQYDKAAGMLQKIIPGKITPTVSDLQQDAYLRLADATYMRRQYTKAQQMYQNVVDNNLKGADYAFYQLAMVAGAQGKTTKKAQVLSEFAGKYRNSAMAVEANMELANTYMAQEKFDQALTPLNTLMGDPQAVQLQPQILLNMGVCQYNLNDNDAALVAFQKLISQYPNSEQTDDAVDYVKSIFMSQNKAGDYVEYMRKNGKNVSYSEADSLTFNAATALLRKNDQAAAGKAFAAYLQQYPDGQFSLESRFHYADISLSQKDSSTALANYIAVADKAPNKFAEDAALEAARIYYFGQKDYENAAKYFSQAKSVASSPANKLESMRGLLRCQYRLERWTDALANAKDLLTQSNIAVDDRQMANMVIAKNQQLDENTTAAVKSYKVVTGLQKSLYAAEARYRIAEIYYSQNKLKEAENAAFDVINKAGSYDFWITKAYILLGDIYWKEKDYFNAEATFKSVAENASDAGLRAEAAKKLAEVRAAKEQ